MQEVYGDFWGFPANIGAITTNGSIRLDGCGVMGRGIAKEALIRNPYINKWLGMELKQYGNHVRPLQWDGSKLLVSFPVKHKWNQKADIELIERSAHELVELTGWYKDIKSIVLPRPGCGNGGLKWEDVKPVIEPILDDRFYVITWSK